jgi:hypothetical protein
MPQVSRGRQPLKRGAYTVVVLFGFTIALTVTLRNTLDLPPALGMMTGLGLLMIYGWLVRRGELRGDDPAAVAAREVPEGFKPAT